MRTTFAWWPNAGSLPKLGAKVPPSPHNASVPASVRGAYRRQWACISGPISVRPPFPKDAASPDPTLRQKAFHIVSGSAFRQHRGVPRQPPVARFRNSIREMRYCISSRWLLCGRIGADLQCRNLEFHKGTSFSRPATHFACGSREPSGAVGFGVPICPSWRKPPQNMKHQTRRDQTNFCRPFDWLLSNVARRAPVQAVVPLGRKVIHPAHGRFAQTSNGRSRAAALGMQATADTRKPKAQAMMGSRRTAVGRGKA